MRPAKKTLAIVALTASLISCSGQTVPASTPTLPTETLQIHTTTATFPLVLDLTTAYTDTQTRLLFDTRQANYTVLINEVLDGETPYFITNHLPNDLDRNTDIWAAPIGQDGIAVITHPSVDINNLTTEQLRDIYRGRITQWRDLPDSTLNEAIVVVSREDGSGTRAEFERMVMGARPTTPNAIVASSSEFMLQYIANTEHSIGYVSMGYLSTAVKALTINHIAPLQANILNSSYPLRTTLFIIGLEEPTSIYRGFFGWMQSQEGQTIVAQKYTPLMPLVPD